MSSFRHRFTLSIRLVVVLGAALPLAMMTWLTIDAMQSARADERLAVDVQDMSGEVEALVSIESYITIERYWGSAIVALSELGLRPTDVETIVGVDLQSEFDSAQDLVDDLFADAMTDTESLGLAALRSQVNDVRTLVTSADATAASLGAGYEAVESELDRLIDQRVDAITASAIELGAIDGILQSTEQLAAAIELREHATETATAVFSTRFPVQSATDNAVLYLVSAWTQYRALSDDFRTDYPNGDALLDRVQDDPDVAAFLASVERQVQTETGAIEATTAALDLDAELTLFQGSLAAMQQHLDLVDLAASRVGAEADILVSRATNTGANAMLRGTIAAAVTLVMVLITTRWIIDPLRSVSRRASRMLEGDLDDDSAAAGPREVREAQAALNDAARHLRVAEQQAIALKNEDLDAEVLTEPSAGRLGQALQSALAQLRHSIEQREDFRRRLAHEARHDGLTGLPNRVSIIAAAERALARATRSGTYIAVFFIDLDRFKRINDQRGHAVGDKVLRSVAKRIVGGARAGDHVGRLAGDEFVVIAEPVTDLAEALDIAARIRARVTEPMQIDGTWLTPAASIGVAIGGDAEATADEIFRDADLAVYRAKASATGIEVCDDELRRELAHRYDIESRLTSALDDDELQLHFQPIVGATDHRVKSLEALTRWPVDPVIGPGEFIPIAERSDLIIDIDRWVLRKAIAQLASWSDDPFWKRVPISVNVSARHLSSAELASSVEAMLRVHRVDGDRLIIEITESAILDDLDHAIRELKTLRSLGVRIAIDDFGTGYTSLSHLRELPIDVLKLDREFIISEEIDSEGTLAKLIVDAGHLLGVAVTAEGVETVEQASAMHRIGADHLQGFLFGHAVPADELSAWASDAGVVAG